MAAVRGRKTHAVAVTHVNIEHTCACAERDTAGPVRPAPSRTSRRGPRQARMQARLGSVSRLRAPSRATFGTKQGVQKPKHRFVVRRSCRILAVESATLLNPCLLTRRRHHHERELCASPMMQDRCGRPRIIRGRMWGA